MLEHALKYRSMGFSVIPIKPDFDPVEQKFLKKPYIKWAEYQKRHPTEDEIRTWWKQFPKAMIGIVTGDISKVAVIDCDSPESYEHIQTLLPDSFSTPIAATPRGGRHIWFHANGTKLSNATAFYPKTDFRGEGGYIVAPPSINSDGGKYAWLEDLGIDNVSPQEIPLNIISTLRGGYRGGEESKEQQILQSLQFLQKGTRDDDLFHVLNCLAKGGYEKGRAYKVAEIIAEACTPPLPLSEAKIKVDSAFDRQGKKKRNLMDEIRGYCSLHEPNIFLTEAYETLQILHSDEKANAQVCFHRLATVEKVLVKVTRGHYRKVQPNVANKFITDPLVEFPIILPVDLNRQCKLYTKNIIIVAGTKSSGKTAVLMKIAMENQSKIPVVYLNSEMGDEEYTDRMVNLGVKCEDDIKFEMIECHANYEDHITPERKIFIVDYLEIHKDFYAVAEYIRIIHEKLRDGIAIIAIQKKDGSAFGRGGEFTIEKARLALNLDFLPDQKCTRFTIVDAKNPKRSGVRGAFRDVKIINGSSLSPVSDWKYPHGD